MWFHHAPAPYMCMYAVQSYSVVIVYIIYYGKIAKITQNYFHDNTWISSFEATNPLSSTHVNFAASSKAHSGYGLSQDVELKRRLILVYPMPKIIFDWVLQIIKIDIIYLGSISFFYYPLWYFQLKTTYHYWIQKLPDANPSLCNLHICNLWHPLLSAKAIAQYINPCIFSDSYAIYFSFQRIK